MIHVGKDGEQFLVQMDYKAIEQPCYVNKFDSQLLAFQKIDFLICMRPSCLLKGNLSSKNSQDQSNQYWWKCHPEKKNSHDPNKKKEKDDFSKELQELENKFSTFLTMHASYRIIQKKVVSQPVFEIFVAHLCNILKIDMATDFRYISNESSWDKHVFSVRTSKPSLKKAFPGSEVSILDRSLHDPERRNPFAWYHSFLEEKCYLLKCVVTSDNIWKILNRV